MASETLALGDAIVALATYAIIIYTSYRAFSVRRSLAVGLYRRQALWVAAIAILFFVVFGIDDLFIFGLPYNTDIDLLVSFLNNGTILVIFGWVDTSTLIARRSDPLLRNTIRWTGVRKPIWALLVILDILVFGIAISSVASGGSLAGPPPRDELVGLTLFLTIPLLLDVVLLPLSAVRSRDPVLHRHLRWLSFLVLDVFGLAILFVPALLSNQGTGFLDLSKAIVAQPASNLAFFCLPLAAAYLLLRSAGSLAPINRMSRDE